MFQAIGCMMNQNVTESYKYLTLIIQPLKKNYLCKNFWARKVRVTH